jgi:hypothetical protein
LDRPFVPAIGDNILNISYFLCRGNFKEYKLFGGKASVFYKVYFGFKRKYIKSCRLYLDIEKVNVPVFLSFTLLILLSINCWVVLGKIVLKQCDKLQHKIIKWFFFIVSQQKVVVLAFWFSIVSKPNEQISTIGIHKSGNSFNHIPLKFISYFYQKFDLFYQKKCVTNTFRRFLGHLYRRLENLDNDSKLIQQHIYQSCRDLFNQQLDVVFYDVTTFYFIAQVR